MLSGDDDLKDRLTSEVVSAEDGEVLCNSVVVCLCGLPTGPFKPLCSEKQVLVCFGERKCPVTFSTSLSVAEERKLFLSSLFSVFDDVLGTDIQPQAVILQCKSEKWGGEFVDLEDEAAL